MQVLVICLEGNIAVTAQIVLSVKNIFSIAPQLEFNRHFRTANVPPRTAFVQSVISVPMPMLIGLISPKAQVCKSVLRKIPHTMHT